MFGLLGTAALYLTLFSSTTFCANAIIRRAPCANSTSTALNPACCVWYDVLGEIQDELFSGGQCDEVAHDALRLSFHDAIGYSKAFAAIPQFPGGGADGSIIKFGWIELSYPGNAGLDETVMEMQPIADKYGVSYGDFIQFAAAVSVRNCQGGPRLEFFAGRPDAVAPAPQFGLLPDAASSVDDILARMADGGFSANEVVDLLASHSVGFQEKIDRTVAFTPFDSTVEVFDGQFFLDTLLNGTIDIGQTGLKSGEALSPIPGEFRLQSDAAIARDSRTACRWQRYITDSTGMQRNFKAAMAKMAVVGHDKATLTDCSEVIPTPVGLAVPSPTLAPGKVFEDIEWSCNTRLTSSETARIHRNTGPVEEIPRAFGN